MARTSPNNIENLNQDWGNDTNVNLPFSGEAVQTFIKSYLRNVTAAAWFNQTNYTMYFFASEADRDSYINDPSQTSLPTFSCPMNFSSTLYRVNITNNTGSTNIKVATNAGTLTLSTTFVVQSKAITDQNWTDLQTGCYVTVLIDRGLTGVYEPITERTLYAAGSTISLDVFQYLITGTNRVKFNFEAEDDTVTQALTYTVNLAELYVELFENTWYYAILESDASTQQLGGFKIAGAGSKTLHFNIYNEAGTKVVNDIQVLIGTTNAYANTPYYYQIPLDSPILGLETGVYSIEVYVTTTAMESERISYNVMFVETEDVATAKLVCLNFVADKIYNYSTGILCSYSIYDGTESAADLTVTYRRKNGNTVVSTTTQALSDVATQATHNLSYEVVWAGIEGTGYSIDFTITLDSVSESANVPIDNSSVFPPTPNYDFYMLASNRSNSEAAKDKIINFVDDSQLTATWTDVDFVNGIDGWTVDDNGRPCLRIPAKTKMVLPYTSFNLLSGDRQTFEICYKVINVADYDENIITLSPNPTAAGFQGIRIKPTNITVHSAENVNGDNDAKQGTNLCDDEAVHFALTVNPNYEGNHKLVKGYVNGCKNFLFEYNSSSAWSGFNGNLTIGSERSDIFVYFIRHYATALSDGAIQTNYINSLTTVAERNEVDQKFASVLDSGGTNVDFEAVKNNNYNYFVVTMVQGSSVPHGGLHDADAWGKKTEGSSVLEMHYGMHPEWDWRIGSPDIAVETMGQGTTSMNYYRWNIRWRIDKSNSDPADPNDKKKVPIQYVTARTKTGGSYQYTWSEAALGKTIRFDGTVHPPLMRITAKINAASSMQSHKIGATRAYTALHDAIGLKNEAQDAVASGDPMPVVAVYEYPAFGFEYDPNSNTYTYVGLFTIGPDKGDKPTFGFDTTKNTLISMEGTDHSQPLARFAYPFLEGTGKGSVNYFYGQEGLAINTGDGSYLTGLEIGNCHNKEIDKDNKDNKAALDEPIIRGILDSEFWPAYTLIWENSTLIFPVNPSDYGQSSVSDTLAYINAHLTGETVQENFRLTMYDDRLTYADMQFWIVGDNTYTLYYYDEAYKEYKPDISLATQLGTPSGSTATEKNDWFKAQRRAAFMADAADYWDLDECLYHFVFCLIFGATDNFAKNSYPYKMATIANDGRWRWRQDDLDTIFDIDNSGRDTKPYFIEFEDARNNTAYFAGSNSVFWNLINECYWEDYNNGAGRGIRSIGQAVINQMMRLSGKNNPYDGFVEYISQCFWGNAQDYFPVSAYNVDCTFKYEMAWIGNQQEVPPLEQALGNHYSGERLWVQRRALYMLSLFRYGPFGDYSDGKLGRISFCPIALALELVPFFWMYPAVEIGQNTVVTGDRTEPGDDCEVAASVDPSGNTYAYIQATNYLASLGNLKNTKLGANEAANLTVTAAKLITFLIGDATAGNVDTNIPGLIFENTACLETIDARNASAIQSLSGLGNCTRLRTLLLAGTSVPYIDLPAGSKIETLSTPAFTSIILLGLRHLSSYSSSSYASVQTIRIEDCPLDALAIVESAYAASSSLEYIRIIWDGVVNRTQSVVNTLVALSGSPYKGLDADGSTVLPKPYLGGDMQLSGMYSDDFSKLQISSTEPYQTTLTRGLSGLFNSPFYVIYDENTIYISFVDSTVESICATNWGSNGHITMTQAAAVTNNQLGYTFKGNTDITSFDELQYFTGLTEIKGNNSSSDPGAFGNCSNLESITIPSTVTYIYHYVFYNCSSLEEITFTSSFKAGYIGVFTGCTSLTRLNIPSADVYANCSFNTMSAPFSASQDGHLYVNGVELKSIVLSSGITNIPNSHFRYCTGITDVTLPSSVTTISQNAFANCSSLTTLTLPGTVITINGDAFSYSPISKIYGFENVSANQYAFRYATAISELHCSSIDAFFTNAFNNSTSSSPFNGSTAETRGIYVNNTLVTNITVPSTITSISQYKFYKNNTITSVTIPNTVTTIGASAFQSCTGLNGDLVIPSNVTSIGGDAFRGCSGLSNLYCYSTNSGNDLSILTFGGAVKSGGVVYIAATVYGATSVDTWNANTLIVGGYLNTAGGARPIVGRYYLVQLRIWGNYSNSYNGGIIATGGNNTKASVKFFEITGKFLTSSGRIWGADGMVDSGVIIHLAYDTVTNNELPCTPTNVQANVNNVTKVYVGDGSSAAHDNAILAMYTADSAWSAYSSKLDTWYNYSGDYKTPPTLPPDPALSE